MSKNYLCLSKQMFKYIVSHRKLNHFEFHIIGDGVLKRELEAKATSNILFYGKKSHKEISELLNDMDLNIIIRSIIIHNETASFHVGAGVVADSVPEKEYFETLDKAAPMIEALSMEK